MTKEFGVCGRNAFFPPLMSITHCGKGWISNTEREFFWTVGIWALRIASTKGTGNGPVTTEILG